MAKVLDALRRQNAAPSPTPEPAPAAEPPEGEPEFIEIGPKRELIAASPLVLAAAPRPQPAAPLPGPHGVLFRTVAPAELPAPPRPVRFAAELVTYHAPESAVAGRYAELYAAIREAAGAKAVVDHLLVLLTATRDGVGTTTVLLNVAIAAARQGKRTLVIDANLRRPAVAARLGIDPAPGLAEVLSADSSLDAALRATEQPRLVALAAGAPAPLLADVRTLRDLLAGLRERFDLVLVDGPRWDGRSTVTALAAGCDGVFLVVPAAEADGPPASELLQELPRQGVRLAGSILTAR